MTQQGVDAVQFATIATAAGVTRQLVYRFFPSRQALVIEVLEDFADEMTQRFGRNVARDLPSNMAEATSIFVAAACDTIAAKGAGPWQLLDAHGPEPEIARRARAIQDRMIAPWHARIAAATGTNERQAKTVARMLVAAGRAALDLWCAGALTRDEAVRDAARGMSAILAAFTVAGDRHARRGTPRSPA